MPSAQRSEMLFVYLNSRCSGANFTSLNDENFLLKNKTKPNSSQMLKDVPTVWLCLNFKCSGWKRRKTTQKSFL